MTCTRRHLFIAVLLAWCIAGTASAITITGATDAKALVSASPVAAPAATTVLKISFQTNTAGTNLSFCAGTIADYNAGNCPMLLGASGGVSFQSLAVVEASQLNGKALYVLRKVGTVNAKYTLIIE
jgi:hypothetical protein